MAGGGRGEGVQEYGNDGRGGGRGEGEHEYFSYIVSGGDGGQELRESHRAFSSSLPLQSPRNSCFPVEWKTELGRGGGGGGWGGGWGGWMAQVRVRVLTNAQDLAGIVNYAVPRSSHIVHTCTHMYCMYCIYHYTYLYAHAYLYCTYKIRCVVTAKEQQCLLLVHCVVFGRLQAYFCSILYLRYITLLYCIL